MAPWASFQLLTYTIGLRDVAAHPSEGESKGRKSRDKAHTRPREGPRRRASEDKGRLGGEDGPLESPRPKARGPSRLKMEVSERKLFRNRRSFNLKSKNERWPFLHALDKILRTWGESDLTS